MKLSFLTILLFLHYSHCEDVATSISGIEKLLIVEQNLINFLEGYINENENKLYILKRKLDEYKEENAIGSRDTEKYVNNPLSSFSLIRRVASDWTDIMKFINSAPGKLYYSQITKILKSPEFPNSEDIFEAVEGFLRIQSTYKLEPMEVMRGVINGVQYDHEMNSKDLFELGTIAFSQGRHFYADEWLKASSAKYDLENNKNYYFNFDKETILEKAVENKIAQEDFFGAWRYVNQLLEVNPKSSKGLESLQNIDDTISYNYFNNITKKIKFFEEPTKPYDKMIIEMGCRDELTSDFTSALFCYYEKENHPFLKLAPIKVEIVNSENPFMVIFHEVISDKEIQILKDLSKTGLKRALVSNSTLNSSEKSNTRTAKLVWYDERDHKIFSTLIQRSEDMSGLSLSTYDRFQVMNYGIGGHYSVHNDFFGIPKNVDGFQYTKFQNGDRIATMLFYLSDVEQGGFTIFPNIFKAVKPKKGTCVFWYNLQPNCDGLIRSRHTACPVLVGNKWVMNIWIRSSGQMFKKPCPAGYQ
ncbi:hypothetical protein ACFFRR_010826 [Megaselia abdita]